MKLDYGAARPHPLLRKIRLPRHRLHHRRDRAAPVLLQRAAGRLPGLRRPRREAAVRRGPRRPQPRALDQEGRGRALGQVQPALALLHAGARAARPRLRLRPRNAVGRASRGGAATSSSTAPRAAPSPSPSSTAASPTRSRSRSKASSATSTAACSRPKVAWMREELQQLPGQPPVRGLPRRPPQARGARVKIAGEDISLSTRRSVADALAWFGSLEEKLDRASSRKSRTPSSRKSTSGSASSTMSASTISTSTAPRARSRGGESQRIRLASQIGSGLSGVLYVLDEPSIGLHQKDNDRLLETLKRLQAASATPCSSSSMTRTRSATPTMSSTWAPAPASTAARSSAQGTLDELLACEDSITADYLTGRREVPLPKRRRKGTGKNVTVQGRPRQQPRRTSPRSSRSAPSPASPASAARASPR